MSENLPCVSYSLERITSHKLTKVKLAIELLTVDNVEPVWYISNHVGNLEVEPLMMMINIHIRIQDQVILILANLQNSYIINPFKPSIP